MNMDLTKNPTDVKVVFILKMNMFIDILKNICLY